MKTKLLTSILFFFLTPSLFGQAKAEWGKLKKYEKEMTVCAFDSTAGAVILSDFEKIEVSGIDPLKIRHHKRIKILKDKAKDRANIVIPYYHGDGIDDVTYIEAQTINIENGKIDKISLKKKEFFRVKVDEYRSELRFTFPQVSAGSIIEYSYIIETKRYSHLKNWSFQTDIPTLFSQVTAHIDTRFRYRISYQGARLQAKYLDGSHNTWLLTNLQAIKPEPFCPNEHDYIEQVNFQLESYLTGSGVRETVLKTWDEFAKDLITENEFSRIINKENKGDDILATIITENDTPLEKLLTIFNYTCVNFEWNDYVGIFPSKNLKALMEDKSGSAQEINLFLILLLRSAGFVADPVLISTKEHGIISKDLPFADQFNLLICNVNLDGKDILLDASKGRRPYNLMDESNLNEYGFLLHRDNPRWIDIPMEKKTRTIKMVTMELKDPEHIQYKLEVSSRGYDAFDSRKEISADGLKEYAINSIFRDGADILIDSISAKDLEVLEKPTFITTFVTDNNLSVVNGDFVYLNPFVDYFDDTNLFADEQRYFPVDLYYPFEEGYILNLTIPEEYEVVEYPKTMNLKLPGDKGVLLFSSTLTNNNFMLRINISFKDHFFFPAEYPFLKEIYDLYIEKRQEQIVLKKRT